MTCCDDSCHMSQSDRKVAKLCRPVPFSVEGLHILWLLQVQTQQFLDPSIAHGTGAPVVTTEGLPADKDTLMVVHCGKGLGSEVPPAPLAER